MTRQWESFLYNDSPGTHPQGSFVFNPTNPYVTSLPSAQESSVLGLLLKRGSVAQTTPKPTMASPITRTVFKQQLQRQQLEQLEQHEKKINQTLQTFHDSQNIAVPSNSLPSATNANSDVPTSVLQVRF